MGDNWANHINIKLAPLTLGLLSILTLYKLGIVFRKDKNIFAFYVHWDGAAS